MSAVALRPYVPADTKRCAEIFRASIEELAEPILAPGEAQELLYAARAFVRANASKRPAEAFPGHKGPAYPSDLPPAACPPAAGWPGTASRSRQLSLAVHTRLPAASVMTIS